MTACAHFVHPGAAPWLDLPLSGGISCRIRIRSEWCRRDAALPVAVGD